MGLKVPCYLDIRVFSNGREVGARRQGELRAKDRSDNGDGGRDRGIGDSKAHYKCQ